jgi:hypothetical protein
MAVASDLLTFRAKRLQLKPRKSIVRESRLMMLFAAGK